VLLVVVWAARVRRNGTAAGIIAPGSFGTASPTRDDGARTDIATVWGMLARRGHGDSIFCWLSG